MRIKYCKQDFIELGISFGVSAVIILVIMLFTGCERRELYVYGDEFHSVELEVNWRKYATNDPDGMTVWFYSLDNPERQPYRTTSANVRHQDIFLPGGYYQGVVVDYSPEEYSRQAFEGVDRLETLRVVATAASYQPDSTTVMGEGVSKGLCDSVNTELFGEAAWTSLISGRPVIRKETGLFTVLNQPEPMALDTLDNAFIDPGEFGDYIPMDRRDNYQQQLTIKKLYSEPKTIIWKMRIRIWIEDGFNYLWQTPASITGLADGHYLGSDENTDNPCIIFFENWETERVGENSGYISTTISTFGLCPSTVNATRGDTSGAGTTDMCLPEALRLNLCMVLRDHATVVNYHLNVGNHVISFDEQLALRLELAPSDFAAGNPDGIKPIELPQVEAFNGTGFGADVTPWEDQPPVDVRF